MSKKRVKKDIEDISGVGPEIAFRLRYAGYTDLQTIATASPKDLADKCMIGKKKAMDIIEEAMLCACIGGFETGDIIHMRGTGTKKLSTGSKAFDELIGGGLSSKSIVEIYGKSESSNTQLCFQLAVNATLPEEKGGLDSDVIIIDTENAFRPERIIQMVNYLGVDPDGVLRRIHVARAFNSRHQILLIEKAHELAQQKKIRLMIIDSLTSHFRSEYSGRGASAERQRLLNMHMNDLLIFATQNYATIVVTNQVVGNTTKPIEEQIIGSFTSFRLYLRKGKDGKRVVKLVESPYSPEGKAEFIWSEKGVVEKTEQIS